MNINNSPTTSANKSHLNVINALLKISSLVLSKLTLTQIYEKIHEIIAEIIYVKNIAIFLYEPSDELIVFDYFVDEKDSVIIGTSMPIGEGLSSYVISKNTPCLFTSAEQEELKAKGKISHIIGSLSESWMGAPISNDEGIMGIIIIQSYSSNHMYEENDLQLLSFVASNLAIVLQQRKFINKEIEDKESLESGLKLIKKQNVVLESMMKKLNDTQDELVQKEKMASLGNLVAGIAHEINTPIGICVTAITNLHHQYKTLKKNITNNTASDKHLDYFFEDVDEACTIIESNTLRAAKLINSFKEIAVDQSSEASREINMKEYIDEILLSLRPILKKLPHEVIVQCPDNLVVKTIPGAISQVLTNMINNSIIHGLNNNDKGCIQITIVKENDCFVICYQDNGKGLNEDEIKMLFEPFYTTKRGSGGSGLGTHLIYNLVTSTLNGKITVQSEPNKGLRYNMSIPIQSL
ncbi:GAF domain-containing sensor histidine kinase [Colwellia sp. 12G3]|uniref:GAF domain-containing sensor histidine kinase n=1 Tax=Colwellia sp. 12G3 TaxID=2058299 RepID=UPI000C3413C1|nr:GAF domain-containing sensor histidine kinase [Colwellia sp. 12G3]PKI17949.1 histidine kinase [Colwellia sp. 12G3]